MEGLKVISRQKRKTKAKYKDLKNLLEYRNEMFALISHLSVQSTKNNTQQKQSEWQSRFLRAQTCHAEQVEAEFHLSPTWAYKTSTIPKWPIASDSHA